MPLAMAFGLFIIVSVVGVYTVAIALDLLGGAGEVWIPRFQFQDGLELSPLYSVILLAILS